MPDPKDHQCPRCGQPFIEGTNRCPIHGKTGLLGSAMARIRKGPKNLAGRRIGTRFTLSRRLGTGAMGEVYSAIQHSVDREVAIKVIRGARGDDDVSAKRFMREAKLASRIQHANSVTVLDFGQTAEGLLYLVMEKIRGRPLDEVMRAEQPLSIQRTLNIARQIADGLHLVY